MWDGLADLCETLDIAGFIPDTYAAYRPLIVDGLLFFLDRLPPVRAAEILRAQALLPPAASPAERLTAMMRCCPTLHKAGQVIARDRRLDPDLRRQLQQLESLPSRHVDAVWNELPRDPALQIADQPLAEASVAIVIPFTWHPRLGPAQEGVFKVLKPGVTDRLGEELALWPDLASFLEDRCATERLPPIPFRDTLERVRQLLSGEIHLTTEQAHIAEAMQCYADSPEVLVPGLLPFCTPRVTAMQRVHGRKVTDAPLQPGARRRLADTVVQALIARPLWDPAAAALFHADPHAGNLFVTCDGRLAILDWTLAAHLRKTERMHLTQIVLAACALDARAMARAIAALSHTPMDDGAVGRIVSEAVGRIARGSFPGLEWLVDVLDGLAVSGAAGFSEDLLFFRKALFSISGVLADLCPGYAPDGALLAAGARAFASESASRLCAPPDSRDFRTHAANADLAALWAAWPWTTVQRWATWCGDALRMAAAAGGGAGT
jgi:ubiquinone biosynthesis protein